MESWKKGRDEIIEYMTRACVDITNNVAAEIDEQNTTRIPNDELSFLRQESGKVDKLAEENKRLSQELKSYTAASSQIEALEKENKRLTRALEQALQHRRTPCLGTPSGPQTPGSTEPPSSVRRIEDDNPNAASTEKYNVLVEKYNRFFKNNGELKQSNRTLQDARKKDKQKYEDLFLQHEGQTQELAKREDTIRKQEDEIRRLKARLYVCVEGLESSITVPALGQSSLILTDPSQQLQIPYFPKAIIPMESIEDVEPQPQGPVIEIGSSQPEDNDVEDNATELPNLLQEGKFEVEDTQFVPMEAEHHSSSTQDDPISPARSLHDLSTTDAQKFVGSLSSDDLPEFISARSVKKRKTRHQATPVSKIKIERFGSSPIGIAAFHQLNPSDSLDLDDIGGKVDTPKKQRHAVHLAHQAHEISPRSSSLLDPESTGSAHDPLQDTPTRRDGLSQTGAALQPLSTNRQILPRTSGDGPSKKRRFASDKAVYELAESGSQEETPLRVVAATTLAGLLSKPSPQKRVLSPIQANRNDIPKSNNQQARSRASATSALVREFRNRSDDESDGAPSPKSKQSRGSPTRSRPSSRGNLRSSAEPPRPASRIASTEPTESSKRSLGRENNKHENSSKLARPQSKTPVNASTPSSSDSAISVRSSRATPLNGLQAGIGSSKLSSKSKARLRPHTDASRGEWDNNPDPENEPLRCRRVETLHLEDFKINPAYNEGYNYAFKEVVRKQADRRCLPGCTRPDCCGAGTRAVAELLLESKPLRLSQQERLLEDYMGDNAYKLRNLSKAERKEMLVLAKTRDLANSGGKHRHAYQRPPSPPGYWNVDFPTTQEEELNREKQAEYVRGLVRERYEQAMRPGGAYIFRDE